MYNIEINEINSSFVFTFHGPINSINAEEVDNFVTTNIVGKSSVIFDFMDVDYISSAGLRIILKIGKNVPNFEVINVKPDVYEVFDMTGFTQILKVKKAMREISIVGKEVIGEGFLGRVYRLDPETVIKVYYRNSSIEDIKREIALAKTAFILGIPTAIPFDVVKVKEGYYGSVFELLSSSCFNKYFINNPEKTDEYIKIYVNLLKSIIDIEVKDDSQLPKKIDAARFWHSELTRLQAFEPEVLDKMKYLIDTIPNEKHLIHGDYHIKNIMMQGNEPLLIDMDTLGVGHEIFEFCAFFLTYIGYPSTDENNSMEFLGIPQSTSDKLFQSSIDGVFGDRSVEERKSIVDKLALLGYFWLTYKTYVYEPENKARMEHSKSEVLRLIKIVDTLAF